MAAKYLYNYLSGAAPDVLYKLSVNPSSIEESASKNQVVRRFDDLSEEVISLSDTPYFYVSLSYNIKSESDSGTIFDFWVDENKANGLKNKFLWDHPHDGYTYVVKFGTGLSRSLITPTIFRPASVVLRVFGYITAEYYLAYDGLVTSFTVGKTIYGGSSGATAVIESIDTENSRLFLTSINGAFTNNEIICEENFGNELITNSKFTDWTGDNPDDWIVYFEDANNYVTESSSKCRIVSDNSQPVQTLQQVLTEGEFYFVSVECTDAASGSSYVYMGNDYKFSINTVQTYSGVYQCGAANDAFVLAMGGACDITIDNVSVKKILGGHATANGTLTAI